MKHLGFLTLFGRDTNEGRERRFKLPNITNMRNVKIKITNPKKMKMKKIYSVILISLMFIQFAKSQAVWTQFDGPYSGSVASYTSSGDTLYCGTSQSGVYVSIDNGYTWGRILEAKNGFLSALQMYKSHFFASWNSGSYISEDKGLSWEECPSLPGTNKFYLFNSNLYAAALTGVFLYDTISNTWIDKSNGLTDTSGISQSVVNITSIGNRLFIVTFHNLYFSDDFGDSWSLLPAPFGSDPFQIRVMTSNSDTLYIVNDLDQKLYSSADSGISWNPVMIIGAVYDFAWHNGAAYIPSSFGVFRYTPGDLTLKCYPGNNFFSAFANDSMIFVSSDNGLYRLDNANDTLLLSNIGINSSVVNDLDVFNNSLFSATNQGVYYMPSEGGDWSIVDSTKNTRSNCITVTDSSIYVGTSNGIFTSNDLISWVHADGGLISTTSKNVFDIQIDIENNLMYAGTQGGLYKSVDWGQNWNFVNGPVGDIYKIAIGNNMVLASSYTGLYALTEGLDSLHLIGFDDDRVMALKIIDSAVYVSLLYYDSGIFKSIDSCVSWTKVSDYTANDICKRGYGNLYAGSFSDMLYSQDNGNSFDNWSETGMPIGYVNCIFQGDSVFYAGTYGNSIYKRSYLNLTDCSSQTYTINDSLIMGIPLNTPFDSIVRNIDLAHGASIELMESTLNRPLNYAPKKNLITAGDKLKIIAEDGITSKILSLDNITAVGKIETQKNDDFIFPNPATGIINLGPLCSSRTEIMIFDLNGKQIFLGYCVDNQFDISNLKNGVYIIKLVDEKFVIVDKLIKE
jgi:photosystem II stability/assembly factor-like uncharacterized protein